MIFKTLKKFFSSTVAWSYNIQEQTMEIFVNGAAVASCGGRLAFRGTGDVFLGTSAAGPYVGHLRELNLYESAVTQAADSHPERFWEAEYRPRSLRIYVKQAMEDGELGRVTQEHEKVVCEPHCSKVSYRSRVAP